MYLGSWIKLENLMFGKYEHPKFVDLEASFVMSAFSALISAPSSLVSAVSVSYLELSDRGERKPEF